MKIKKGDTVFIRAGKDRGKTGKVVLAIPKSGLVVVEGINMRKKHQRPTRSNQKGQMIEKAMPVRVSTVMAIDPSNKKPTRVGKQLIGNVYVRVSKKTGTQLDK